MFICGSNAVSSLPLPFLLVVSPSRGIVITDPQLLNNLDTLAWVGAGAAAFIIGLSKTGLPGIGILAVTVLAMSMPAKLSVGVMLPMLIVGDIFACIYYRRLPQWRYIWRVAPPAGVGIVIGFFLMGAIGEPLLRRLIGVIAIVLLTLQLLRDLGVFTNERIPHHWLFAWSLGLSAGIFTMMANAAGPIMIVFFLAMGLDRFRFIGTIAWYFMLLNLFKVPFFVGLGMIGGTSLFFDLKLVPVILIGACVGIFAPRLIPEKPFRWVILTLAAAAAIKLLAFG